MPQFDPSSFAPQLFWLAVTFIALYFAMARLALPRIGAVLDERQRKIDDNLAKTAALKAEAEAAVAAYERALADSRLQAQNVMREMTDRLARQAEERNRDVAERLAQQIKAGEDRIAAAKSQALVNIRAVAVEVAGAAAERLGGIKVAEGKVEAAVAAVLKERPQ